MQRATILHHIALIGYSVFMNETIFKNPAAEFRGAPFWAWNCKLEKEELLRQIGIYQEMGIGGFHMHSRTGLDTQYLGEEFMDCVRLCVDDAKRRDMKAWLYDEDRWPSGFGGGLVTENPEYRMQFLLFTQTPYGKDMPVECNIPCAAAVRSENGTLLARYAVVLKEGCLKEYRRLSGPEDVPENSTLWYAYLETAQPSEWFNGQTYVNTLKKEAIECFTRCTHERYKAVVGDEFGRTVSGIFTDEPQFTGKQYFASPDDPRDLIIPFTSEFTDGFSARYGYDFPDVLPELFWEIPEGGASVHRYRYHDYIAALFAENYAGTLGAWCRRNHLKLTGHLMNEPSLGSQTGSVGEVMRSYVEFDIPGIDIINDYFEYTSAKQAQSVARQQGCAGIMSELYGVTNWDYDFKGHKAQGDWQAALGVVLRVHHLTWVSMKGEAKRDYPASIGYQSPWYKRYSVVEDYFARVNAMLTQGRPVVRIGVIHPVESYWLAYGPASQTGAERAHREKQFDEICRTLLFGLTDFDFIAESLLPKQCDPEQIENRFPVGQMEYEVVVIPGMRTIRETTLIRLEKFVESGGVVLFAGEIPSLVDAIPSVRPLQLAQKSQRCNFTTYDLSRHMAEFRDIAVQHEDGTPAEQLMYQLRQQDSERVLFLCNTHRVQAKENLKVILDSEWICREMDTFTGEVKEMVCGYEEGQTVFRRTLHPAGSLLLSMKPGRGTLVSSGDPDVCFAETRLPAASRYSMSEPNVLLLDQFSWQWNDEPHEPKDEMLRIDKQLRQKLDLKQRNGLGRQPWADTAPAPVLGTLTLQAEFESQQEFSGCELAVEDPEQMEITFNGEIVETAASSEWWVDRCIFKIPLPVIRKGMNTLCIRRPYCRTTDLEWFYLLGRFGVQLLGDRSVLTDLPEALPYGDWTHYGFPFYAGNMDYHIDLPEGCPAAVKIPFFKGSLVDVFWNGQPVGTAAFPPYEVRLPPSEPGEDGVLTLRVYGNRVNAFGSVHNTDMHRNDWVRYGPLGYRSEGKDWAYEYQLRPMGILTAPLCFR